MILTVNLKHGSIKPYNIPIKEIVTLTDGVTISLVIDEEKIKELYSNSADQKGKEESKEKVKRCEPELLRDNTINYQRIRELLIDFKNSSQELDVFNYMYNPEKHADIIEKTSKIYKYLKQLSKTFNVKIKFNYFNNKQLGIYTFVLRKDEGI